jgi:hypothetical protein
VEHAATRKRPARVTSEKPYLQILIDHLRPSGEVLEVGFALGYSAARIQTYHPKRHTIIEPDPKTAKKALKWAKDNPAISVLCDAWENALPKLGVFDAIFFNAPGEELEVSSGIVQKGKELVAMVKQQLPQLMNLRYSDSDIDAFFSQAISLQPRETAYFLHELRQNKQISEQQYEKTLQKYRLEKAEAGTLKMIETPKDCTLAFLKACLKNHMRKGSRFSCFTNSPISKYENPEFFESIITNPNLDYQEKLINEHLVITVEKQIS